MNKLYMKIRGFEEPSCSLLVSFASDTTKSSNPDDYPQYSFQPINMWPDITDPTEIIKRIAVAGVYHVEQQEREETFTADSSKVDTYRGMVGNTTEFNMNDLIAPPGTHETTPLIEVL